MSDGPSGVVDFGVSFSSGFSGQNSGIVLPTFALVLLILSMVLQKTKFVATLDPPAVPFPPFLGEGFPTKIDYRQKSGTLILTSPLEELVPYQGL